jgi:hypothetical protein
MHCLPLRGWVWEQDCSGCRDWSGALFIGSTPCGAAEYQLVGTVEEERRRGSLPLQVAGSARPHGEPGAERGRDAVGDLDLSGPRAVSPSAPSSTPRVTGPGPSVTSCRATLGSTGRYARG